jgi:sugar phosphate permease
MHYAVYIAAITFLTIFVAGGIRSAPGVLTVALETEFGWSRATISGAVALSLFLYGALGPFVATFMRLYSLRRTVLVALLFLIFGTTLTIVMTTPVHLYLLWGLIVGLGSGVVAPVLGKVISGRWFSKGASTAMGLFSASAQTGQVLLAPALGALTERYGWRSASIALAIVAGAAILPVLLGLKDHPEEIGVRAYGAIPTEAEDAVRAPSPSASPTQLRDIFTLPFVELRRLVQRRDFVLIALSFFVCGASTNGLIGVHLVPACVDSGLTETSSAGFLAVIGIFDIVGTLISGWLTDRWGNSRRLLSFFYFFRGAALIFLPWALRLGPAALWPYAVVYGLDWVSTVPPTAQLCVECFGKESSNVAFAWVLFFHQVGAAAASAGAGAARTSLGTYSHVFFASGGLCILTAALVLLIPTVNKDNKGVQDSSVEADER